MLFLLLKNSKDSSLAESSCLTLALATHTKKIKSFDGKRGGSHKMLISDVCHNRGVSHYRILPISRDIGWPVQQLDYFRHKATYTDC